MVWWITSAVTWSEIGMFQISLSLNQIFLRPATEASIRHNPGMTTDFEIFIAVISFPPFVRV
jgi:hypothetical protein